MEERLVVAMNWSQIERHMRERGFYFVRHARHGELWYNGAAYVMAPTPSSSRKSYSAERNFIAQVNRAIRMLSRGKTESEDEWHQGIEPLLEECESTAEELRLRTEIQDFLYAELAEARALLLLYSAKYDAAPAEPFFRRYPGGKS